MSSKNVTLVQERDGEKQLWLVLTNENEKREVSSETATSLLGWAKKEEWPTQKLSTFETGEPVIKLELCSEPHGKGEMKTLYESTMKSLKELYSGDEWFESNVHTFFVDTLRRTLGKKLTGFGRRPTIAVTGCYNSGKSTMLNAMIGSNILHTSSAAATSAMFYIRQDPSCNEPELRPLQGNESLTKTKPLCQGTYVLFDRIKEFNDSLRAAKNENETKVDLEKNFYVVSTNMQAQFQVPVDCVPDLVDNPGFNECFNEMVRQRVKKQLHRSDMVLVLAPIQGVQSQDLMDFFKQAFLELDQSFVKTIESENNSKLCLVITKVDSTKQSDQDKAKAQIAKVASDAFKYLFQQDLNVHQKNIVAITALDIVKRQLLTKYTASNSFPDFDDHETPQGAELHRFFQRKLPYKNFCKKDPTSFKGAEWDLLMRETLEPMCKASHEHQLSTIKQSIGDAFQSCLNGANLIKSEIKDASALEGTELKAKITTAKKQAARFEELEKSILSSMEEKCKTLGESLVSIRENSGKKFVRLMETFVDSEVEKTYDSEANARNDIRVKLAPVMELVGKLLHKTREQVRVCVEDFLEELRSSSRLTLCSSRGKIYSSLSIQEALYKEFDLAITKNDEFFSVKDAIVRSFLDKIHVSYDQVIQDIVHNSVYSKTADEMVDNPEYSEKRANVDRIKQYADSLPDSVHRGRRKHIFAPRPKVPNPRKVHELNKYQVALADLNNCPRKIRRSCRVTAANASDCFRRAKDKITPQLKNLDVGTDICHSKLQVHFEKLVESISETLGKQLRVLSGMMDSSKLNHGAKIDRIDSIIGRIEAMKF